MEMTMTKIALSTTTSNTTTPIDDTEGLLAALRAIRAAVQAGTGSATADDDEQADVALANRARANAQLTYLEEQLATLEPHSRTSKVETIAGEAEGLLDTIEEATGRIANAHAYLHHLSAEAGTSLGDKSERCVADIGLVVDCVTELQKYMASLSGAARDNAAEQVE
jgi:hypothetical protein